MNRGDVCLAHFPFTDASAAKVRPVLVISADAFNSGGDVVVLPISSAPDSKDAHSFMIDSSSQLFAPSGLRKTSSVKWTKPTTIAKTVIIRRLGRLPKEAVDQITSLLFSSLS